MLFSYKGYDKKGNAVSGTIEASNANEAKTKLKAQNIYYTTLKEKNNLNAFNLFKKRKKLSPTELASLSRDLSLYIKSGIPITNAIPLAMAQYESNKTVYSFLSSIKKYIDEGKSFYAALEMQDILELPPFYKQSIKVSETSGILDQVLLELSNYLKTQSRVNKQIQNALAYPLFILVVSIFIVAFMIVYIVPKITSMFAQLHQELPTITKYVISLSNFLQTNYISLTFVLISIAIAFWLMLKNRTVRYYFDYFVLKVPFLGKIIKNFELGRFSYISSLLIKSGVPFVQSVRLSAKVLNNSYLEDIFEKGAQKVVEGEKLSTTLVKYKNIDKNFTQAIMLGEETSEMVKILENLYQLYQEENKDNIEMFLSLLEPVLMLMVGGIIGLIVTAMLLPIFSINIQG